MATRIFVGNLPQDVRKGEIEDLFDKYGRIRDIDIKTPQRPPAFAFVTFDDPRDAEDAVRGRDGIKFDGLRLRVELSRGERNGGRDRDRGVEDRGAGGSRFARGIRRTDYGVVVSNIPRSCSWQDLKDFMRTIGDVTYADVNHSKGEGVVEFSNKEDMDRAIREKDDTEFRNRDDSKYIRVKSRSSGGRSRSRSRERDGGRERERDQDRGSRKSDRGRKSSLSPSRSPSRGRERDRRSLSPVKKDAESGARGRSPSRSRTPSPPRKASTHDDKDRERDEPRDGERERDL